MKNSVLWFKYHHFSMCYLLVALTFVCSVADARAQKIVSLVNDQIITSYDIEQRMKLLQLINAQSSVNILQEHVLDELIEEQLILAEAKRLGIETSEEEIQAILKTIANQTENTVETFISLLQEKEGIDINTLKLRIMSQLTWQNIITSKFNNSVQVDRKEVDIFLAETGGSRLLKRYEYAIRNVVLLFGKDRSKEAAQRRLEEAQHLAGQISSCSTLTRITTELRDVVVGETVHRRSEDLSPAIQKIISNIEINGTTPPYMTDNSIKFLVICNKKEILDEAISRLEAQNQLTNNKLSVLSRQYLNEMKKQAVIEYR